MFAEKNLLGKAIKHEWKGYFVCLCDPNEVFLSSIQRESMKGSELDIEGQIL